MSRVTPKSSKTPNRSSRSSNLSTPRSAPKERQLTKDEQREIREAFDIFDTDRSNSIDRHEFRVAVAAMGLPMVKKEIMDLFDEYDPSGRAGLNREQFEKIIAEKMLQRDPLYESKRTFQLFDSDSTGKISLKNLKTAVLNIQKSMTNDHLMRKRKKLADMTPEEIQLLPPEEIQARIDEEETQHFINQLLQMKDRDLQAMIQEFDLDNDGQINYEEFLNIVEPSNK